MADYDLVVIGTGPAGQKAAIAAAKMGRRVVAVERRQCVGGVCIHVGTIPSKTIREAVMYLTGARYREIYGAAYRVKRKIGIQDLTYRLQKVVDHESQVILDQLQRNDVEIVYGEAAFLDPHRVEVRGPEGSRILEADRFVLAVGAKPARPPHIPFNGTTILDPDGIFSLRELPKKGIIVGAGIVGTEYATIFQALGVRITLVDARERPLEFVDDEIEDALMFHMRDIGMVTRFGEKVVAVESDAAGKVRVGFESGKSMTADAILFAAGRVGATDTLNLGAAGLEADDRGRLAVNEHFQTEVAHIYAAGDVVGFPALASTAMEQGRIAASHAFGAPQGGLSDLIPFGIYTIPEISMVGPTEQKLTADGIPYESGVARYRELARGQIIGDSKGLLKLLFHRETRRILAVHILGEQAAELVHIGQAAMAFGATIDYFRDVVFNYPTLAEAYKVAALNGFNKL